MSCSAFWIAVLSGTLTSVIIAWRADRVTRDLRQTREELARVRSQAEAKKREADIFAEPQGTKEQIIDRL